MRSGHAWAWRRLTDARVATLATVDSAGAPHLVPVCFALDPASERGAGQPDPAPEGTAVLWMALDEKPKTATRLRRYANIRRHPRVSLLVQHWDEDWSRLWWVRVDGTATTHTDASTVDYAVGLLRRKYSQYQRVGLGAPVIAVTVGRLSPWSAAGHT